MPCCRGCPCSVTSWRQGPGGGGGEPRSDRLAAVRSVKDSIEKLDTRLRARNEALVRQVESLEKDVAALKKAEGN